ncbi:DUF4179 domain-containing protein [Paenibacillus filicis]|uniref:DUF4179 domain-containing protein n=1 Tax=Paenibacillus filicis TaxID=669464 RepID=A0ABU9DF20_9BACL
MNSQQDQYLRELARKERPELPDFDAMWQRIQTNLETPEKFPRSQRDREARSGLRRRTTRLLPAAAAISTLLVAAPVVAGMTLGWPELMGRLGVSTAFNNGFGNPLDITVGSEGVDVTLHGVVTDAKRLDILFSAVVPDMPSYDYVKFTKASLTDGKGKSDELVNLIPTNASGGKLTGLLETDNGLSWGRNKLSLTLEGLTFFKYTDTPLPAPTAQLQAGQIIPTGTDYGALSIVSVERNGETVSIRYEVPVSSAEASHAHPHLFLTWGDKRISSDYAAVLPTDKENIQLSQANFKLTAREWEQASLHFSYLEKIRTIGGHWSASFDVDDSKARMAIYRQKLEVPEAANDSSMKFKELSITPLQIRIDYDDVRMLPHDAQYDYETYQLQVGERVISGGRWHDDKTRWFLRFESPEWYKDWSGVPMKLLLSDLIIRKRSTDQWQPLQQVTEQRQSFETTLDGFQVIFRYYRQGDDLLVESESADERFLGIGQTAIKQDGKWIYPEMDPMPPGGNGSSRRVNKYPGLLANKGKLELSPGFYSYRVPGHTREISIHN